MVIEPYHWHMMHLKSIMVVCVLICICLLEIMITILCWYNIDMVMRGIWMWRFSHIIKFLVVVKFCQYCFRMLFFNSFYVGNVPKVKFMNDMTDIKCFDFLIDHQSGKYILICVWTDMEITWYFFDSKRSHQSASIIILKCSFCHLKLFSLIRLSQQLEIITIKSLSIRIQSVFFYWPFFI